MTTIEHPEIWSADWIFSTKDKFVVIYDVVTPKLPVSCLQKKPSIIERALSKVDQSHELLIDKRSGQPIFSLNFKKFLGYVNQDTDEPCTDFS